MLQCTHRAEKLAFWFEALALNNHPTSLRDTQQGITHTCHAIILDVGLNYRDPGLVPNGAACGDDKVKPLTHDIVS